MQNTSNSENKTNILKFIKCVSEKNFAEANKYLKDAVNIILKNKIVDAAKKI
jgi:hypothetical protein